MKKTMGGVGITPPTTTPNNICMDYLTITWQFDSDEEYANTDILGGLMKYLNVSKIEVVKDLKVKGFYGYRNKINLGNYIFYQDNLKTDPALKIYSKMVEFSGQGCRDLERRKVDLVKFAYWVFRTGGKITRFDLAYDDFQLEHCDIFKIFDYIKDNNFTSSIRSWNYNIGFKNKKYKEHAITFGERSSKRQLQIYDKLLERKNNYEIDVEFVQNWIRYEMRFRQEFAHLNFKTYIELLKINNYEERNKKIIGFYFSNLLDLLDIKEKDSYKDVRRRKTVDWWSSFTQNVKKIKIRNQYKLESDITTKKDWVKRSVVKPLSKMNLAIGEDKFFKELMKKVKEKETELTPQDFQEIANYKNMLKNTGEIEDW